MKIRYLLVVLSCSLMFIDGCSPSASTTPNNTITGNGLSLHVGTASGQQAPTFTLFAQCPLTDPQCDLATNLRTTLKIFIARLDANHDHITTASFVTTAMGQRVNISVHLPSSSASDVTEIRSLLIAAGQLNIIDTAGVPLDVGTMVASTAYPIEFTQADLKQVFVRPNTRPHVEDFVFTFNDTAKNHVAAYTQANIGKYLTITLDNVVIESAVIQSSITGECVISTDSSNLLDDAYIVLHSQPLPLAVTVAP